MSSEVNLESIRVFAPATVANVACGYDILGFALNQPGDELVAAKNSSPGVEVRAVHGDGGSLPTDPNKNTAAVAVKGLLEKLGSRQGITLELYKKMPIGSGLGSSAASAVAGVFAAHELLGAPLDRKELLPFVIEAERIACGSGHADNVAPSLLGGFVLIRSYKPLDVIKLPLTSNLWCVVVYPDIILRTEDSRSVLKREISLKHVVTQLGNVAGLVTGLFTNDSALIGRSLEDVIIEPERSVLIPGFRAVKAAALASGALGGSISGSGPSIFALCPQEEIARSCATAMQAEFHKLEIKSTAYVSQVNNTGPRVLERNQCTL